MSSLELIAQKLGETCLKRRFACIRGKWPVPQPRVHAATSLLAAGHPLAEVRARTLQALDFKIKYGLITPQDLLQVRRPRSRRVRC